jgi:hypothetical protein
VNWRSWPGAFFVGLSACGRDKKGSRRKSPQHSKRGVGRFQVDVGPGQLAPRLGGVQVIRHWAIPTVMDKLPIGLRLSHTLLCVTVATKYHQPLVASLYLYPNPKKIGIMLQT